MTTGAPYRLAPLASQPFGRALDRKQPIRFRFDEESFTGFAGDTLASALLASGVRTVARSFKFRRPRGFYTSGIEGPNAIVQLHSGGGAIPMARAPLVEIAEGVE